MFFPTHFGSGMSNSETARLAAQRKGDIDFTYRLGIMLEADKQALANETNRQRAQAIFADARALRRQMQEA